VERAQKVRLRGTDLDGHPIEIEAEGLMAVCFQHELDHLDGVLFIDHLSRLKQQRIRDKIEKAAKRKE
jgi:peptide deformylase